jgi:5-formyltetrahydrofolate cyclo-ligase
MGKGHGYFDLEWGILTKIGAANENTPVVTIIHDLQYVEDLDIPVTPHDSIVDYIITPTRAIKVEKKYKKPMGMDWSMLDEKYIESIPPLAELKCRYYTEKK